MKVNRKAVRTLILLSLSAEEADKVIEENYGFQSFSEKLAFLKGMFDVKICDIHDPEGTEKEESDRITYFCMLHTIITTEGV